MSTATETNLPEVSEFLSQSPLKAFIGGKQVAAADGSTFTTRDPGTGLPLAEVSAMSATDVDQAVRAADSSSGC